ncbi:OprO/OprP family phosphate-selective porin [Methylotenera versatilis]|uniref:Phosphate-selective porin O and P n=1 Tax=Methylotenera versatilis (strain 301) TaxID=666681 RepID=D7DKB9_METV0|nr:porin [Methylotenera versatilis]ADI28504.1 phosphate-selective porin O and P [Methylotenera versatilis 301]
MQFKYTKFASALIASGIISLPITAHANDSSELEELRSLVQDLSQKVKVLERKGEISGEEATAAKATTPIVSAGPGGFSLKSADGSSELRLRGQIQVDGRYFVNGDGSASGSTNATAAQAADTVLLKQFRPIFQGKLWDKYEFLLTPDFGGGKTIVQDAYIDAKFNPWFQVKAGKQKSPFGLERLQGDADGKFIERSLVNNLVPNRDIGVQLHGAFADNKVEYALGYFNGVIDGNSSDNYTNADTDNNRDKDYVARIFATPFKNDTGFLQGLGFGLAATYSNLAGSGTGVNTTTAQSATESNLPSFRSGLGQLSNFKYTTASAGATNGTYADGQRLRWSPQFYYYNGPFGLFGEYVQVEQDVSRVGNTGKRHDKLKNDAWQIAASWIITGEDAGYVNPTVLHPFNVDTGDLGAWELVARYSELNIDDKTFAGTTATSYADPKSSISKASAWATGVNWYLNRNLKLALDYEQTSFNDGWTTGAVKSDRPTERVLSTRLQLGF